MPNPNPYAYFDCLSICRRLESALGNAAESEVHLFAYLSCLLSLYARQPASSWEYSFSVTESGYPYSPELGASLDTLETMGCLEISNTVVRVTLDGMREYENLLTLSQNTEREAFVDGACSTALVMPVGAVRKAISVSADIRQAIELHRSTLLLTETGVDDIYDELATLASVAELDTRELMVPAVVWLTYLRSRADKEL